jgi:hypothetical protein
MACTTSEGWNQSCGQHISQVLYKSTLFFFYLGSDPRRKNLVHNLPTFLRLIFTVSLHLPAYVFQIILFHITFPVKINYYEVQDTERGSSSQRDFPAKLIFFKGRYTMPVRERLTDISNYLSIILFRVEY